MSYQDSYRYTATLMSAISKKGHTPLYTLDNNGAPLLKVYADKELAQEIAVFKPDPSSARQAYSKHFHQSWLLVRQTYTKSSCWLCTNLKADLAAAKATNSPEMAKRAYDHMRDHLSRVKYPAKHGWN